MNLGEFIDTFKDAISRRVVESYPPLYRPSENGERLPHLLRTPLGAQADAIRGAALSLQAHRGTTVVGEMGTGKSFIGAAAAHAAGFRRVLILCPPHLTRKWKREVEQTVPLARTAIVASITDLERLRLSAGSSPLFAVMSRERAKLSYRWQPAVIQRWATEGARLVRDDETGEPFRVPCCATCYAQVTDKDGVPLTDAELRRRKRNCARYGSPLWQADGSGPRRYPLADYVKNRMRGFFDLLVGDEVHEYKGRGSAQGIAAGVLADVIGKSLSLSGTLMGGYSSTLFHLLYRFSPELRADFAHSEEGRWIERYGFLEETRSYPEDDAYEDGRTSRRKGFRKTVREKPGLVPSALFHIIGNSVFLKLADVASALPPYEEQVLLSGMDSEPDATGFSQRSAYGHVFDELHEALVKALKKGSKRLLATYLQTLLAYPDGCTHGETVFDPASGKLIVQVPPLTGVCKVISGGGVVGDFQVGLGFGPGFGQQPDPVPEAALEQQSPQPVDAVADYADLPFRLLPTVAMPGRQRLGRSSQVAWGDPAVMGVFHPGAVGQGQQRGHRQHQPVAGYAGWVGSPGLVPLPAYTFEGLEAQFDPEPQGVPTGPHFLGRQVGEDDPGFLLLGVPNHEQGATALGGWGTEGGSAANPGCIRTGNEAQSGQPAPTIGAESDVLPIAHTGVPALGAYLLPQLGTGYAPVAEDNHGHFLGNGWGQFLEQFHGGVHPGAALGGAVDAPGHGNGAAPVEDADDDGGGLIALEGGVDGQGQPAGTPPGKHPAEQRVTSSWVLQGRARSLPS